MEILIVNWEEMEKLILETLVPSYVMIVLNQEVVPVEHVEMMGAGMALTLLVQVLVCMV